MTPLEKVKSFFATAFVWLKTFGWIFGLVALGVVVWIFAAEKNRAADQLAMRLEAAVESHRKQVAEIQRIKTEEQTRRDRIEANYRAEIERISRDHANAVVIIDKEKQDEVKRIIAETQGNPDAMAARVNEVFGLPVVSSRDEVQ